MTRALPCGVMAPEAGTSRGHTAKVELILMDRADVVGRVPAGATVLVTETAGGWVLVTYVGDGVSITGWPPKHLLY